MKARSLDSDASKKKNRLQRIPGPKAVTVCEISDTCHVSIVGCARNSTSIHNFTPTLTLTMGSAQSYMVSPEAALTTVVIAGAVGLGYTQMGRSSTTVKSSTDATPQSDKGKKKRAKSSGDSSNKGNTNNDKSQHQTVQNPLPVFPGQFEPTTSPDSHLSDVAATSSSMSKAKKPKKKKPKSAATTDPIVREVAASSSADYSQVNPRPKI